MHPFMHARMHLHRTLLLFQLLHAASDALSNYKACLPAYQKRDPSAILVPKSLGPFPLYLSALLKSDAFRYSRILSDTELYF